MKIIWLLIEFIASAFENFIIVKTMNALFEIKHSKNRMIINAAYIIGLTLYISVINLVTAFEGWISFLPIAFTILYAFAFYNGSAIYKIIIPITAYSAILIINIFVTYIMTWVFGGRDTFLFSEYDGERLIALFLTKLIFYLSMKLITAILKKDTIVLKSKELFISSVMSVITLFVAISLVRIQMNIQTENMLIFICILCLLMMAIFIIYMMKMLSVDAKDKLQISMLKLQLSEQRSMIEDAGSINTEIKKAEHDLKHHLLSVLGIIENGDLSAAEAYLKELLHEYEISIFKYITIDNSAINSILNLKIGRCHAEKIDIKLEIQSDFAEFNDIDICVLLANLLDNAIEASAKVCSPYISVIIRNEKNYLCILVKNKVNGSVIKNNQHLNTTKSDKENHGLGLYSIAQIVDKYDGIKNYYENNNCFIADIWLKQSGYSLSEHLKAEENCQTRQNQYQTRHSD